jgi:ElaB/YqjD/DUF883 family membrane-anchored ribosome-binding protein
MNLFSTRKDVTTPDRIKNSLRTISHEARGILDNINRDTHVCSNAMKEQLTGIAEFAGEARHELERQARRQADTLNKLVHNRPYECLGIAILAGLFFGLIASSGTKPRR